MKKEVSPIVGVLGILITLTAVMLGYWFGLVGGGKEDVQPKGSAKSAGKAEGAAAEASGPPVGTLAGGAQPGYLDGPAAESLFSGPSGVAVDRDGAVYVADSRNHCLRKIAGDGVVTTFAGTTTEGFADGVGAAARFSGPAAVALAPDGSLFVSDTGNHRIRRIARDGAVSTFAGSDTPRDDIGRAGGGSKDGPATQAQFQYPVGLAVDAAGTVYVADVGNHCVRRISPAGQVTTIAESGGRMDSPTELALVADRLWVSDTGKGQLWTGPREGPLQPWRPAGKEKGPKAPSGLAADGADLYVADSGGHCLFRLTGERFVFVAGKPGVSGFSDGQGGAARFSLPAGLAAGAGGRLYIADFGNNRIRELKPEAESQEGR